MNEKTRVGKMSEGLDGVADGPYNLNHLKTDPFCSNLNESLKREVETEVEICPDISAVFFDSDEDYDQHSDDSEKNYGNVAISSSCEITGPGSSREISAEENEKCASSRKSKTNPVDETEKLRANTFLCYHCKRSFTSELKMRNHLKVSLKSCELCHEEFSHKCLLSMHRRTHHTQKRVCISCNAEFARLSADDDRLPEDEGLDDRNRCVKCAAAKPDDGSLRCRFCEASFVEPSLLYEHERSHDAEKPYQCDICGQRFSLMQHIKRHIEVLHNGGVRYQCKLCQKCFRWDSCLRTHLKTHTNERPHKCSFCEYSFRRPCDLRRHMITHTNEKKFSCTQCDKLFTRNSSMMRHLRTHFGEKPYLCSVCGKRFNESFFLKEHMESHSENRSYYYCDWCNKRFNNRRVLRMHAKKHESTVEVLKMGAEED